MFFVLLYCVMFVLHVVMFSGIDCQEIQELDKSKRFYNLLERFNQMYHFGNQTLNNKNLWTNIFEVIFKDIALYLLLSKCHTKILGSPEHQ